MYVYSSSSNTKEDRRHIVYPEKKEASGLTGVE